MAYRGRGRGSGGPKEICRHYLRGTCTFGDKCRNIHDPAALSGSVVGSASASYVSGGSGGKAARGGATEFCHAALRNVACNKGASCRFSHELLHVSQYGVSGGVNHVCKVGDHLAVAVGNRVDILDGSYTNKGSFEVAGPVDYLHCVGSLLFIAYNAIVPSEGVEVGCIRCIDLPSAATADLTCNGHYSHANVVTCLLSIPAAAPVLVSASLDGKIRMWGLDASRAWACRDFPDGHIRGVSTMVCAPSFNRLVSGGQDNTLRVWDISTFALMATILPASGHAGAIVGLELLPSTPEVSTLISAASDGSVIVWRFAANGLSPLQALPPKGLESPPFIALFCLPPVPGKLPLVIFCPRDDGACEVLKLADPSTAIAPAGTIPAGFAAGEGGQVIGGLTLPLPDAFMLFSTDGMLSVYKFV